MHVSSPRKYLNEALKNIRHSFDILQENQIIFITMKIDNRDRLFPLWTSQKTEETSSTDKQGYLLAYCKLFVIICNYHTLNDTI